MFSSLCPDNRKVYKLLILIYNIITTMKKISFYLIGLCLALFAEFWRFILIAEDTAPNFFGWITIIISYMFVLSFGYYLIKKIKNHLFFYLLFGVLGVFIEFVFLGTNPFEHIIILLWVISFWGTIVLLPRLYVTKNLKRETTIFSIIFFVTFFGFYLITHESSLLAFFYISFNIPFIIWQFRVSRS